MRLLEKDTPSVWMWLVLPVLIMVATVLVEMFLPYESHLVIFSENGPYELAQVLFSGAAFFYALFLLVKMDWKGHAIARVAVLGCAAGTLYITGEELSWGQQILQWDTPAYWSTLNDQNETNLHNTSAWLDQKPRLLLFIGIVVGGLIVPALQRWKPTLLPQKFADLYPRARLGVTALGVLVPYTVQKIPEIFHGSGPFHRVSEVQELYIYYFILLYLLDFRNRVFPKNKFV